MSELDALAAEVERIAYSDECIDNDAETWRAIARWALRRESRAVYKYGAHGKPTAECDACQRIGAIDKLLDQGL